ncbi:hypothetical protein FRB91_009205 [Serendipita sp. 411]|nr:hypothetical protein FRC19_003971 [Serendipita sp. 401]KAG8861294.1 hypothetical protein FRB91_009205 [Serendipita sp. 411]
MTIHASHRRLFRELIRSGRSRPRANRAPIATQVRDIILSGKLSNTDAENAALFLKSQRTYNILLDRYNPLHDLTAEEHIKATARRVGLNMPVEVKESE